MSDCPFEDWENFFPDIPYSRELFEPVSVFLEYFKVYFELRKDDLDFDRILQQATILVDYHAMEALEGVQIQELLLESPQVCLASLNLAATHVDETY
jgi:hypothetical protein